MKRPFWFALFLCTPAFADDPPKPAPVVPVAAIVVPKVQPLVVFADGTTTKTTATWQVVEPADATLRVEGGAALILDPTPGTSYTLALVATGDAPPFALRIVKITAPAPVVIPPVEVPPVVNPPTPPVVVNPPVPGPPAPSPVTPPTPSATDRLGLTASTRAILAKWTWDANSLNFRQANLGKIWSDGAAAALTTASPQDALNAAEAAYKAACGTAWPTWQAQVFKPLKDNLQALQIATGADLSEAMTEIANAFKEKPLARR